MKRIPPRILKQRKITTYSQSLSMTSFLQHVKELEAIGVDPQSILITAYGGYDSGDIEVEGYSLENDKEYNERCQHLEKVRKMVNENKKKKKEKDYQEYLKLKKKFEKK